MRFHNDQLDAALAIRDMLAHRTGITRHGPIRCKSDFSRKELFERLMYIEPKEPLRQLFLCYNLMDAGAGYVDELLSDETWEVLVQERMLDPPSMSGTKFSIDAMKQTGPSGEYVSPRR